MMDSILASLRELRERLGLHPVWPATLNRLRIAWRLCHAEMGVFDYVEEEE